MSSLERLLLLAAKAKGPAFIHQPSGEDLVVLKISEYEALLNQDTTSSSAQENQIHMPTISHEEASEIHAQFEAYMQASEDEVISDVDEHDIQAPVYEPIEEPEELPVPTAQFSSSPIQSTAESLESSPQAEFIAFSQEQPTPQIVQSEKETAYPTPVPPVIPASPASQGLPPMTHEQTTTSFEAFSPLSEPDQEFLDEPI